MDDPQIPPVVDLSLIVFLCGSPMFHNEVGLAGDSHSVGINLNHISVGVVDIDIVSGPRNVRRFASMQILSESEEMLCTILKINLVQALVED